MCTIILWTGIFWGIRWGISYIVYIGLTCLKGVNHYDNFMSVLSMSVVGFHAGKKVVIGGGWVG